MKPDGPSPDPRRLSRTTLGPGQRLWRYMSFIIVINSKLLHGYINSATRHSPCGGAAEPGCVLSALLPQSAANSSRLIRFCPTSSSVPTILRTMPRKKGVRSKITIDKCSGVLPHSTALSIVRTQECGPGLHGFVALGLRPKARNPYVPARTGTLPASDPLPTPVGDDSYNWASNGRRASDSRSYIDTSDSSRCNERGSLQEPLRPHYRDTCG